MRRPPTHDWLAAALSVVCLSLVAARPKPPACEPGGFVVATAEALVPGSALAPPDRIEVGDDGSVSVASGCPAVAGKLHATRRGSSLSAKWTKKKGLCAGLTKKASLKASFDDACETLSGTFKTRGAKRVFSARRAGGPIDAANVEAFAEELHAALATALADVVAALPPASGDPSEKIAPVTIEGFAGSVTATGMRFPRPAPPRYELTLTLSGYVAAPGEVALGGTAELNVVLVERDGALLPFGLVRARLALAGPFGGEVELHASVLVDAPRPRS